MRIDGDFVAKKLEKIYLASPRGFCAGVKRAVTIVDLVLKKHKVPIYVRHEIVHNKHVVNDFKKKGVIFVEDINEVPDSSVIILSAHGSPPSVYEETKKKKLVVYDATCPLVLKVHLEAKRYSKEGFFVIYIGHKNHPEGIGVLGELEQNYKLIENLEQAKLLKLLKTQKIVILTQTTLSFDDTKEIINYLQKQYPNLIKPPIFDICYVTQNRQLAVKTLTKKADLILVVGSRNSSNSNRLRDVAEKAGKKAYLINDETEINKEWLINIENIGLIAGASVPETTVQSVVRYLSKGRPIVEELEFIKENILFPLPSNLL